MSMTASEVMGPKLAAPIWAAVSSCLIGKMMINNPFGSIWEFLKKKKKHPMFPSLVADTTEDSHQVGRPIQPKLGGYS